MGDSTSRRCECNDSRCQLHERGKCTLPAMVFQSVCIICGTRPAPEKKDRQRRTPQMADDFGDTTLFGGKRS